MFLGNPKVKYWAQQGKVEQYFFYWEGGTWGYPDKKNGTWVTEGCPFVPNMFVSRSFTFRRRRSASAAAAMPRRGSSYRYGGVSSSGYSSVRARPKLRYFLLGTAPTIGSAGLGAFTPSLFHAQVFEMFLALFNTGSNLST
jgi:hypothetical protein